MTQSVGERAPEQDWSFGGYPYGIEPLLLPDPTFRWTLGDHTEVDRQLTLLDGDLVEVPTDAPETTDQLFWFRWITGNQAASALWQVLDDQLEMVVDQSDVGAASNAATLLDAYSALLIYSGSPTQEVYHRVLRPAMGLAHRSFSGRWAQDYAPVMAKLQRLRFANRANEPSHPLNALVMASKLNHRVHVAVAAKLVPDDKSLLRTNDGKLLDHPSEQTIRIYDAFYCTMRQPVAREEVVAQLIKRIRVTLWDIAVNGLYPHAASSLQERPVDLWGGPVVDLEEKLVAHLHAAATVSATTVGIDPLRSKGVGKPAWRHR